jgi:hypothetical protein
MSTSTGKDNDEYVTLRLECRNQVRVTTYGTVDLKIPRANRRRVRACWTKESSLVEFLHGSGRIDWGESKSVLASELLVDVRELSDSYHAYRCRWNPDAKAWEFEKAEGDGD